MPTLTTTKSAEKRQARKITLAIIGVTLLGGLTGGLISSLARVFVNAVELAKSPYSSHNGTDYWLEALIWDYPGLWLLLIVGMSIVTTAAFHAFLGMLPSKK